MSLARCAGRSAAILSVPAQVIDLRTPAKLLLTRQPPADYCRAIGTQRRVCEKPCYKTRLPLKAGIAASKHGVAYGDAMQMLVMAAVLGPTMRWGLLRTRRRKMHIVRGIVLIASSLSFFSALKFLPLAEATALNYSTPMIVTVMAAMINSIAESGMASP